LVGTVRCIGFQKYDPDDVARIADVCGRPDSDELLKDRQVSVLTNLGVLSKRVSTLFRAYLTRISLI